MAKPYRKAKVFGRNVPVRLIEGLGEKGGMMGYFCPRTKHIGLCSELKGEVLEQTLVHEVFHAVLNRLYIDSQISIEVQELIIENFCVCLFENFDIKYKK